MYDHYIAVDWAQSNMAIARMTGKSKDIKTMDTISDLGNLRAYLKTLKGKKILTIEETTTSIVVVFRIKGLNFPCFCGQSIFS